ncbi:MAG: ABC transporter ATP-binding protein [Candidatus Hodarchaeota archaeon]
MTFEKSDSNKILEVNELKKWFPVKVGIIDSLRGRNRYVRAVDGVSFDVERGKTLCIVGESGSGKTTIARVILRLEPATEGEVIYRPDAGDESVEYDLITVSGRVIRKLRTDLQIIFQNPYESLDPRMTIFDIIAEPLRVNHICRGAELEERVHRALEEVRMIPPEDFDLRYPHELSGGQRQRIGVARAMVLDPSLLILDEPTSMLDANTRVEILNLMRELQEKYDITYVFVTHDLGQARYVSDRVVILYLGRIAEEGPMEEILDDPKHPYTKVLISNVNLPDPTMKSERIVIPGDIPSAMNVPEGCRFHPRCPWVMDICKEVEPGYTEISPGWRVSCHYEGRELPSVESRIEF